MNKCSLCTRVDTDENSPILTMSAYGNPRYICEDCAKDLDEATTSHNYDEIKSAFDRLGEKIANRAVVDDFINETLQEIMSSAAERAEKIKNGQYDFWLDDEKSAGEMEEVPEELQETDEDRELDERDEEKARKIDKWLNLGFAAALIAAAVIFIIKILG